MSIKGIGVKIKIVGISRFEFGFLKTNDRGVEFQKGWFDFVPIRRETINVPLQDRNLVIVRRIGRRKTGHVVLRSEVMLRDEVIASGVYVCVLSG